MLPKLIKFYDYKLAGFNIVSWSFTTLLFMTIYTLIRRETYFNGELIKISRNVYWGKTYKNVADKWKFQSYSGQGKCVTPRDKYIYIGKLCLLKGKKKREKRAYV